MTEARSALQSSSSSFPSRSCYLHPLVHQMNPTLHYTPARFWPLHPTGVGTNTRLEHKSSVSISPRHVAGSLMSNTLLISSTSFWYYYATFSKDRQAHILTKWCKSSQLTRSVTLRLGGKGFEDMLLRRSLALILRVQRLI